jgi:signal transduction histidine kinase/DNA-binding response OmpR family regulator
MDRSGAPTSSAIATGGGELGALIRAFDWRETSIGLPAAWPKALTTAVGIMLSSRQPIWIGWGPELVYLYNDAYKPIIGGKHPAALGQPTRVVWREIWDYMEPLIDAALGEQQGAYVEEQLLIMERNGYPEETYYTFSFSPIPDDEGNPAGIICANTDDTERVINERQIATLREQAASAGSARGWRAAAATSVETLAFNPRDLTFVAIYVEEQRGGDFVLAGAGGLSEGDIGAPARLRRDEADAVWPVASVAEGREMTLVDLSKAFEVPMPSGAWDRAPAQAAVLPLVPSGNTGRSGALIVGLNPFRLVDEGYRAFLSLVASQVSAAIAAAETYAEERRRAEALAEIDRAKTQFFSNVSHEFRTPLTLMLGPLDDLLADGSLGPVDRDNVEMARRNGERLLKLVNSLLEFSRMEAGRTRARFEPTDLAALTADLASTFRSATDRAGIELVVDCPPLPHPVHVDRDMWEKIVLNLLSNAFKFTFSGRITVTLSAGDGMARLSVSDTGTGVPAAELPRLFERFHRVEGARGRSFEGTGIGLALVDELVRLHGGQISATSVEDEGSTFTVTIPVGTGHLPEEQVAGAAGAVAPSLKARTFVEEALLWLDSPGAAEAVAIEDTRPMILLADDNADMRDYVQKLLAERYRVLPVSDGLAALEAIQRERPGLVVTDVMMPGLDGFGLIARIRGNAAWRDLPVVMLSARAGEEASVEGIDAGADAYLTKPFSARNLVSTVDGMMEMARIRREVADEDSRLLERLNQMGTAVAGELDLGRAVQVVTDATTELTSAAFGAFFYNLVDDKGESYTLYTLSGAPREAFSRFPMPRNTEVFHPTFVGEGVMRSDDITKDARYGKSAPHFGMPDGHLAVRSYLAAPVVSRSGEVLGGLFFGHPEPGRFDARAERLLVMAAAQAAVAIDNARLFQASERELAERRRVEGELQLLNTTLEKRVATEVAARSRTEEQLRQMQKMEALGKLTGGVAHDFNNLLQVINGNLQLLEKDVSGNDRAGQRLRNALGGVDRGAKLASQLLAFGRRQPLAPKVLNLGRLVRGLDEILRRTLGEEIEIETVIAAGLWNVTVDPTQVENAILNLAINARDAMSGQGKLTIEAGNAFLDDNYAEEHLIPAGQYVALAVTDTGAGMSRDVMEQAFEPFFTTKSEGRGTGLGLSMVYGFVKQSGGHVKIYSELGQGTTVRIYLPRVRQEVDRPVESRSQPVAGGTETILVVEDDDEVRATVTELLGDLGYRVLRAKDAQSAFSVIESGVPVDLLFTDVVMPGPMRSTDLARRTRELSPRTAILFTSGYTDNAIVHGGRLDEGVELLSKPYGRETLARKVRQVIRTHLASLDPSREEPLQSVAAPAGGEEPARLRILSVEDDMLINMVTADMLRDLGHEVIEAANATAALGVLDADGIDVLLTDVGLPDRPGTELALEALRRWPHLKVIFATGHSTLAERETHPELAPSALLQKPFDQNGLARAIGQVFGQG